MPSLVDPSDTLPSFQQAMNTGAIHIHPCSLDKTLLHHFDYPQGKPRMTYVRLDEQKQVTALIQFLHVEPYEGERCFGVGWAVPTEFRGKGRSGKTFLDALREIRHVFLSKNPGKGFYVEAIVGIDNLASLKTAKKVFASDGTPGTDSYSGEPILQFVRRIDETTDIQFRDA